MKVPIALNPHQHLLLSAFWFLAILIDGYWYLIVVLTYSHLGNGILFQYSCLENPMGRGTRQATVHGVAKSRTTEWLRFHISLSCIGEGNGNPLQCSCLENPRDGGAWRAAIYGVAQSQTRLKRLSSSSNPQGNTQISVCEFPTKLGQVERIGRVEFKRDREAGSKEFHLIHLLCLSTYSAVH